MMEEKAQQAFLPRLDPYKHKRKPEYGHRGLYQQQVSRNKKGLAKGINRAKIEHDVKPSVDSQPENFNVFGSTKIQGSGLVTLPDVADIEDNPGLDMKAEIHIEIEGDSINYDTAFLPHLFKTTSKQDTPDDEILLEIAGQDLQLPQPKKRTAPKRSPLQGFHPTLQACMEEAGEDTQLLEEYIAGADRMKSLQALKRILLCHAIGIPIEIIQSSGRRDREARPIFHCHNCLIHWQRFGVLPKYCKEVEKLVRGPPIELTGNAAKYLQKVWQNRLARHAYRQSKVATKSHWRNKFKQLTNKDIIDATEAKELLSLLTPDELKLLINQGAITELITEGNLTAEEVKEIMKQGNLGANEMKHLINADTVKHMLDKGNMTADDVKGFLMEGNLDSDAVKQLMNPDTIQQLLKKGMLSAEEMKNLIMDIDMDMNDADDLMDQVSEYQMINKGKLGVEQMKEFLNPGNIKDLINDGLVEAEELCELVNQAITKQLLKQDDVTLDEIEQMIQQESLLASIDEDLLSIDEIKQVINQCTVKQLMQQGKLNLEEIKELLDVDLNKEELEDVVNQGHLNMDEVKELIQAGIVKDLVERGIIHEMLDKEYLHIDDVKDLIYSGAVMDLIDKGGEKTEQMMTMIQDGDIGIVEAKQFFYKGAVKQLIKQDEIGYEEMKELVTDAKLTSQDIQVLIGQGKFDEEESKEMQALLQEHYGTELDRWIKNKFKKHIKGGDNEELSVDQMKEFVTHGMVKQLLDDGDLNAGDVTELINKAMVKQVLKQDAVTAEELENMMASGQLKSLIENGMLSISEVKQVINQCTVKHMMQADKLQFDEVKQLLNLDIHEDEEVHEIINQGQLNMEEVRKMIQAGTVNELVDTGVVKQLITQQYLNKQQVMELVNKGTLQGILEEGDDGSEDLINIMKNGNIDVTEVKDLLYKGTIKQLMRDGSIGYKAIKRLITQCNVSLEDLQVLIGQSSLDTDEKDDIHNRLQHKFGLGLEELLRAKFKQNKNPRRKDHGQGDSDSSDDSDDMIWSQQRRNTFVLPGHVGEDISYNELLDDVLQGYEPADPHHSNKGRRRSRAGSRVLNRANIPGHLSEADKQMHNITSYKTERRNTILAKRLGLESTSRPLLHTNKSNVSMDIDVGPQQTAAIKKVKEKPVIRNPLVKNRTGKPQQRKNTLTTTRRGSIDTAHDGSSVIDEGSRRDVHEDYTTDENSSHDFRYGSRRSSVESSEALYRDSSKPRRPSERGARRASKNDRRIPFHATDEDDNNTDEPGSNKRRPVKKMKDGSVKRTAGRTHNSRQMEDDEDYGYLDSPQHEGDAMYPSRPSTGRRSTILAGSMHYMSQEPSQNAILYYSAQGSRPPSAQHGPECGSRPPSGLQKCDGKQQQSYLPPLNKQGSKRNKKASNNGAMDKQGKPVAEVAPMMKNQKSTSSVKTSATSIDSGTPSDHSIVTTAKPIHPRPALVLPNPDGISILSFTPAFSFSLYALPPGYKKKRDNIQKPKQKTSSEKQKVLPNIKEKRTVRRNSDVANISRKIQQKLSNPKPIAKYVKKLEPVDEDQRSKLSVAERQLRKSEPAIKTSSVVSTTRSTVIKRQASEEKGCQTDPELFLAVFSDPDMRPISVADVDILENVNSRAVQTGPSLLQLENFDRTNSSTMTIHVTDSVIIKVQDYI